MRRSVIVCGLLVPAVALADDAAQKTARARFREAEAAYARGSFAAAAAAFEEAARLAPHPSALLNASDAWLKAGEPVRALEACDRAGALAPLADEHRRAVGECVASLEPKAATLALSGPRTTAARVDGRAEQAIPARVRLSPGRHTLALIDLGSSRSRSFDLELSAGEVRSIDAASAAWAPAPAPAASASAEGPQRPAPAPAARAAAGPPAAAWVAFGVGGAAALVSGMFGALTLGARSRFDTEPTRANADDFYRDRAVTNVALGVAAVSAAVGAVLWLTASPRAESAVGEPRWRGAVVVF